MAMNSKQTPSQKANTSFSAEDFAKALEQQSYDFSKGQMVRGKAFEYEPEGAYIDIGGKSPAFLPLREASVKPVRDLSEVLPLQEERDFLIVSEPNSEGQVTVSIRQMELKKIWDNLAEVQDNNQSVPVRVTGVNKGGVTVDVQGLRGFIPRSHLIERNNLEALIGESLSATFLEVNRDRNKLVLSQRLEAQSNRIRQLEVGQLVEGEIVSIKPFGVFVDLDGATALLHINQVSKNYVQSLNALFNLGQTIKAIIIDVDEWKGRISLSTKVLENYAGEIVEQMDEVMATAEARRKTDSKKDSQ